MKLKNLSELIVFDEFPKKYNHQQCIVLTHLLHLEKQIMPEKLCRIYTTPFLGAQFKEYCKQKAASCLQTLDMHLVDPYTSIDIVLGGGKQSLQLFFCESKESTRNLLILIKEGGKVKCIYSGNFKDVRSAILNDNFVQMIGDDAIPCLYLNLKRFDESPEKQDVDVIHKVFESVQQILDTFPTHVHHMYIPQYGYDDFILKFCRRFPQRVTISSYFKSSLNTVACEKTLDFTDEGIKKTIILLFPFTTLTEQNPVCPYTKREIVTIHLVGEPKNMKIQQILSTNTNYTLYYTPEPSPFHLQLMCLIFKPQRLCGIIDAFNINSKVPQYLLELCGSTQPAERNKSRSRLVKSLGSLPDGKESGKVLVFGPRLNKQPTKLYLDDDEDSESD